MRVVRSTRIRNANPDINVHIHKEWEISVAIHGDSISEINGKEYTIKNGDIMIVPPNVLHIRKYTHDFSYVNVGVQDLGELNVRVMRDTDGNVAKLLKTIYKEFIKKEYNYHRICNCLFESVFQYMKREQATTVKKKFVADFKEVLYNNISNENFEINDAIKSLDYNVDYFRRAFVEDLKMTPREYLLQLRIEQAKNILLNDEGIKISQIASKCGFVDSLYFSKVFKNNVGVSPRHFREQFDI